MDFLVIAFAALTILEVIIGVIDTKKRPARAPTQAEQERYTGDRLFYPPKQE